MGTRLVTILGTGARHVAAYSFAGKEVARTASIDAAIVKQFGVTHVYALGTGEAVLSRTTPGISNHLDAVRKGLDLPEGVELRVTTIGYGRTTAEFWKVFEGVRETLRAAMDACAAESADQPPEVLLNLTHGFRTQPIIAQSAALFEREERRREGKTPVPMRLLYGAIEQGAREGQGGGSPARPGEIWDMTDVVEAHAWGAAITELIDYGHADQFAALLRDLQRRVFVKGAASQPAFQTLGAVSKELTDSLATLRLHQLISAPAHRGNNRQSVAAKTRARIQSERRSLVDRLPPLDAAFGSLESLVSEMSATTLTSREGIDAALRACRWLLGTGQHAAFLAAAEETFITMRALQRGAVAGHEPGPASFDLTKRKRFSNWLNSEQSPDRNFFRALARLRNDVMHASYNQDPLTAEAVIKQFSKLLDDLMEMRNEPAMQPPTREPGLFVNLSNHPSDRWSPAQRQGALKLGQTILDKPFPMVDPKASEHDVLELARKLCMEIEALKPSAVAVQGEHALTCAVVSSLQGSNLPCYSATTERNAEETREGDTVLRSSVFNFVQWRRYPSLREAAENG